MARPITQADLHRAAQRPARVTHHPLATRRTRNTLQYPAGTPLAPCTGCGADMPATRIGDPVLQGECSACCADRWAAQPVAPEYETVVWSRGERL